MKPSINKNILLDALQKISLFGIVITVAFSKLNLNSIFIIGLAVSWIVAVKAGNLRVIKNHLFIAFLLYFLVQIIGLYTSGSPAAGLKFLESKLGFLILPLILLTPGFLKDKTRDSTMLVFISALAAASVYCLVIAGVRFMTNHDPNVFFYHALVSPVKHHAVYFSAYLIIGIAFLSTSYKNIYPLNRSKWLVFAIIGFFLLLIVLLSSKLMLSIAIVLLGYLVTKHNKTTYKKWQLITVAGVFVVGIATLVLTENFVKKRFTNLFEGNIALVKSEKFNPGNSFTGFEFRLLLWRFTYEIVQENNAFLLGVGTADSQDYLVKKYLSMDMYAGDLSKGDHGYLAYNCHNQFLQTFLQSGIVGLLILCFWCYTFLAECLKAKNLVATVSAVIILLFFFTESVLERQYGMILCSFFPVIFLRNSSNKA